jgi:hypothetical protein
MKSRAAEPKTALYPNTGGRRHRLRTELRCTPSITVANCAMSAAAPPLSEI